MKTQSLVFGFYFLCMWAIGLQAGQEYFIEPAERKPVHPRVTIISSVYNSDQFIEEFLHDIVQQTIFSECELLMVDANSPGNEAPVIKRYMEQYPNITYVKLAQDPGLYGVWNLGALLARSDYITNANTDDRLAFNCYALHAQTLDEHPEVDLVYSDFLYTKGANETMEHNTADYRSNFPEFSPCHISNCLPNNHPMWRTSMHTKYGYFDENYLSAGDWEMWCRAVEGGALFKKVPGILALFYRNPVGLSTNDAKLNSRKLEQQSIYKQYGYFFYQKPRFKRDLVSLSSSGKRKSKAHYEARKKIYREKRNQRRENQASKAANKKRIK